MTDTNTAAALSAEADGWIEWHGGENPVPGKMVKVRHRLGVPTTMLSDKLPWWKHRGEPQDIIAYRVAAPAPAALEGSSLGEEMFGVTGASDEVEALACAIWAHRCPGLLMDEDDDRPHYMAAAKAAFDALEEPTALQPSSAADAKPVAIVPPHCTGTSLSFDPGVLHVSKDGSGYIAISEEHFSLEDDRGEGPDGPEGSIHWITRLDASEIVALRDFLNGTAQPQPSQQAGVEGERFRADEDVRFVRHADAGREIMNLSFFITEAPSGPVAAILAALKPVEG